jgi:hypothetical protein
LELKSALLLDEFHIGDIPQVLEEENAILTTSCMNDEVNEVIFQMEHNKFPCPDWFLAWFYQKIWDVIKIFVSVVS